MTVSPVMTTAEFVEQVGRACAGLPQDQHVRVMAALEAHLEQHSSDNDPVSDSEYPTDLARELRHVLEREAGRRHVPRLRLRTVVASLSVAIVIVIGMLAALIIAKQGSGRTPSAQASPAPGIIPSGLVEGSLTYEQQPVTAKIGSVLVCLIDETNRSSSCLASYGTYRLANLPGAYTVTATFEPAISDPTMSPTDPNFHKPVPCALSGTVVTMTVNSDTHLDFAC